MKLSDDSDLLRVEQVSPESSLEKQIAIAIGDRVDRKCRKHVGCPRDKEDDPHYSASSGRQKTAEQHERVCGNRRDDVLQRGAHTQNQIHQERGYVPQPDKKPVHVLAQPKAVAEARRAALGGPTGVIASLPLQKCHRVYCHALPRPDPAHALVRFPFDGNGIGSGTEYL